MLIELRNRKYLYSLVGSIRHIFTVLCTVNILGMVSPFLWTFISGFLGCYTWSYENQKIIH